MTANNHTSPKQSTRTGSSKRRVVINPTVETVDTLSIYDYTPSEIAAAWFDHEEMDKITHRCLQVLQRMAVGKHTNKKGKKYVSRGLEGHSTLGSISKAKTRAAAFEAVLEEQERQRNENPNSNEGIDVQAISDAYQKVTSSSQLWARAVGNQDRRAADAYIYEGEEEDEDNDGDNNNDGGTT